MLVLYASDFSVSTALPSEPEVDAPGACNATGNNLEHLIELTLTP